jgi:TRAP-type C4-dicarboxylate transport system permease small subunit
MKALAGRVLALSRLLLVSLRGLVTALVVVFFSYMIGAILVQVAGRYVFDYAIDWTAETATFAQVWMVLLAAGLAMRDKLHVSVDVLTQSLPLPAARVLIVAVALPCLWFLWQAVAGSIALIEVGRLQASPVLRMPMWLPYLSLPVGLVYFGLEFLLALAQRWQRPVRPGDAT